MNRLLRIAFDLAVFSFIPVLSWFALGIIVDKNLINVFSLTYPIQFIYYVFKSIFGTGANISKEKDNNKNAVLSGMTLGIIISFIVFGFIVINIEKYINFMNMDIAIYKVFAIYSVIQLFIQLVFSFVLEKLYFENREKQANKYCIILNILNFCVLILSSLIFKNQVYIVICTLAAITIYVTFVTVKSFEKFKFNCNIINCIKYDSVEIFNSIAFFFIFLFGLSNAFEFGEKYIIVINFIALITDTQWDSLDSISTVAKIDISKNKFNYKKHKENAYKLLSILLLTVFVMYILFYNFYKPELILSIIFIGFELINFLIYPIYKIKTCYLQLEYSAKKITSNKIISSIIRMLLTYIKTPFCTGIGQVVSSFYQFITINYIFNKNYRIDEEGIIKKI